MVSSTAPQLGRNWSLPNILTYARVAAVPLVAGFLFWPQAPWARWTALAIFVAAGISDFFDGYLARAWSQQSSLGRMLDPIADKLLVSAVILVGGVALIRLLGARAAVPAGLVAGVLYGAMAVAVRVVGGVDPLRLGVLLADPASWTVALAGLGGFYLFTVALQLGSVNGASAALVVGETVVPGVTGVVLLGDTAQRGLGWLVAVAFVTAVVAAVAVAIFGAGAPEANSAVPVRDQPVGDADDLIYRDGEGQPGGAGVPGR